MNISGRAKYFFKLLISVVGLIYTVTTVILSFWSWDQIGITGGCDKAWILFGVIPLSALLAWIILLCTNKVTVWERGNAAIVLRYGDLHSFAFPSQKKKPVQKRIVLISMNTHFDTLVNNSVVSETSVHGKWIGWMKEHGIESDELNCRIKLAALKQKLIPIRTDQKEGNIEAYQRGTIIDFEYENTRFFLLALSEFDDNLNAQTNKDQVIDIVKKICDYYDKYGCGQPMFTPLIGTELSRTNMTEHESLMIMKSMFQLYSEKIHNVLNIVIYKKQRSKISIFE
ncbi:MAG: macro domain-containing protein [Acetivibrionales bacterium]|jgi:hypothetical protein